jgi:hypothetical protein
MGIKRKLLLAYREEDQSMNERDSRNLERLARLADRNSPGVPPSVQKAVLLIIAVAVVVLIIKSMIGG